MLGDTVAKALATVGVTPERVEHWLGRKGGCGCKGRQAKLNALDAWARRVLTGKVEDARKHLSSLTGGIIGVEKPEEKTKDE